MHGYRSDEVQARRARGHEVKFDILIQDLRHQVVITAQDTFGELKRQISNTISTHEEDVGHRGAADSTSLYIEDSKVALRAANNCPISRVFGTSTQVSLVVVQERQVPSEAGSWIDLAVPLSPTESYVDASEWSSPGRQQIAEDYQPSSGSIHDDSTEGGVVKIQVGNLGYHTPDASTRDSDSLGTCDAGYPATESTRETYPPSNSFEQLLTENPRGIKVEFNGEAKLICLHSRDTFADLRKRIGKTFHLRSTQFALRASESNNTPLAYKDFSLVEDTLDEMDMLTVEAVPQSRVKALNENSQFLIWK